MCECPQITKHTPKVHQKSTWSQSNNSSATAGNDVFPSVGHGGDKVAVSH